MANELIFPLTGGLLAGAIQGDFQWFFEKDVAFKVEILGGPVAWPQFRKDAQGEFVVIPNEMADQQIDDGDTLLFHLLMIGHELAHLVNGHGKIFDEPPEDTVALEAWADWYGAKVAMTLLFYGPVMMGYRQHFFPEHDIDDLLKSMARALERLVKSVYVDGNRYPEKAARVSMTVCGVWSHLRLSKTKPGFDFYERVALYLMGTNAVREVLLFADAQTFDPDLIARVRKLHRAVQGEDKAITMGMVDGALRYLHTTWSQTDEELKIAEAIRRAEVEALGWDLSGAEEGEIEKASSMQEGAVERSEPTTETRSTR